MHNITLVVRKQFSSTSEELKNKLEEKLQLYQSATTYANSEASLTWIINGCIDYFDQLDSFFLGGGNAPGVPSMEADHFANNIYRLEKAVTYLARLWRLEPVKSEGLKLLLDLRTLIVHSGEQLNKIESLIWRGIKTANWAAFLIGADIIHFILFMSFLIWITAL